MAFRVYIIASWAFWAPVLLMAFVLPRPMQAQAPPDTLLAADPAEALLETLEDEAGAAGLAELLMALAEAPLDVNAASAEALAQVPALGLLLAERLVTYRTQHGPFDALPALQQVEGLTEAVYLAARPYLRIGPRLAPTAAARYPASPRLGAVLTGLRYDVIQRVTRRLDLGPGYAADTTRTTYLGTPERLYTRLRATYGRQVSLNLTLEKDPGEAFAWAPAQQTYGFDHLTAHFALRDFGRLQSLIVGDYEANFGQGVALWRGIAAGKGRETVRPVARVGTGLRGYGSTDENRFFRGLAAAVRLTPALTLSAFASRRRLDATLSPNEAPPVAPRAALVVTSLGNTGLHRTPSEQGRKDRVRETMLGGDLSWRHARSQVGLVVYQSQLDHPVQPGNQPYQRFAFAGTSAHLVSLYARSPVGADALAFGEMARSAHGMLGGLGGLTYRSGPLETLLLARHFPRDFVSRHGFAFGERNGATQNETGVYVGLGLRLGSVWRLAGYLDQYRFPWLQSGRARPSQGADALLFLSYQPRSWWHAYLQVRSETKEDGVAHPSQAGPLLEALEPATRQSARLHLMYQFSDRLTVQGRVEGVWARRPSTPSAQGFLLYQQLRWAATSWARLDLRMTLFDTDHFDARVFTYETDLLYTFAVPAFSGQGQRWYALLRLAPSPRLVFEAKYATTRYEDAESVGSGLDEAPGPRLRELRLQARWRF